MTPRDTAPRAREEPGLAAPVDVPAPSRRGKTNRRRGGDFEREIATLLREHDIPVVRTGEYKADDLLVCLDGVERVWECKRRKNANKLLSPDTYGAWAVVHRGDRCEPEINLRLSDFLALITPLEAA